MIGSTFKGLTASQGPISDETVVIDSTILIIRNRVRSGQGKLKNQGKSESLFQSLENRGISIIHQLSGKVLEGKFMGRKSKFSAQSNIL